MNAIILFFVACTLIVASQVHAAFKEPPEPTVRWVSNLPEGVELGLCSDGTVIWRSVK